MISVTLFTDPACPWAYSANPPLHVLEWRYGDQLEWRLVLIGLTESAWQYEQRGYTTLMLAFSQVRFRERYGMPFASVPKTRLSATARACRAVVAARLAQPGIEFAVLRALQLANFTSGLLLDDDAQVAAALDAAGFDGQRLVAMLDSPEVSETYERDRAESRTAVGSPAELQGKTATSDGPVRYTAPSVTFELEGRRLVAGGFQPIEAYDVLLANLDPTLRRRRPPETPEPLLDYFPAGLTTQEVAVLMAHGNAPPDRLAAERALIELVAGGRVRRVALGGDAVWHIAGVPSPPQTASQAHASVARPSKAPWPRHARRNVS